MCNAIQEKENVLGFTLQNRLSSRHPKQSICDLDFEDNIVLLSDDIEKAKKLLQIVQKECRGVGLEWNA